VRKERKVFDTFVGEGYEEDCLEGADYIRDLNVDEFREIRGF